MIVFLVLSLLLSFSNTQAQKEDKKDSGKSISTNPPGIKKIGGISHIYNSDTPLKGTIALEVEKVLEIDSLKVDPDKSVFFDTASKSADGGVYIGDMNEIRIYNFNLKGELLNQFFRKGEGPGEIPFGVFSIQELNKNPWILSGRKIMHFDSNRKLLEEFKLKKDYRDIELVDENRFIGNSFIYNQESNKSKKRKCCCILVDRNETALTIFLEDFNAGITEVTEKVGDQELKLNFFALVVTPRIIHRLSSNREILYLCLSSDYSIFLKTLRGEEIKVIHRKHKSRSLLDDDRKEIVENTFSRQPLQIRELIKKNLPEYFCVVSDLQLLPKGYLAIIRITGIHTFDIDIFDPEGRFIYLLKLPDNISGRNMQFYENTISIISTVDDRDIYREFKIKNLPEIFGK